MPDLWILAGQSNMEGYGDLSDVAPPHREVRSFVHGDLWRSAEEPLHWLLEANDPVHWGDAPESELPALRAQYRKERVKGAGCALTFASAVADDAGVSIDLVPAAHGGTSMQQWSPGLASAGGRSLYGAMLRRTRLALETSPESVLRGVLWYQGESDASPDDAPHYAQRMKQLIHSWRSDLGCPDLPFFVVQIGLFVTPAGSYPDADISWSAIREEQRRLPEQIGSLHTVPAIDLEMDDLVHVGTHGLKRLGRRLANAALASVYSRSAPKPLTLASVRRVGDASLRVAFDNVTGGLRSPDPSGRVPGFGLVARGIHEASAFYKARIDRFDNNAVILHVQDGLPPGELQLTYGYGLNPFCQLTDAFDMAAPAFGPVAIMA